MTNEKMSLEGKLNNPLKALKEINKHICYSQKGLSYIPITLEDEDYIRHNPFRCSKCSTYLDIEEKGYLVFTYGDILCPKCFEKFEKELFVTQYMRTLQDDITTYRWYLAHFDEDVKIHRFDIF